MRQVQDGILSDCCQVVLVFSNRADAKGLETAAAMGFETRCLESKGVKRTTFDQRLIDLLEPYRVDYLVLAGYMRILSPLLVNRYFERIVNIHPADTRAYQGLHGYEWAHRQRLPATSITVHLVDEGVDTGPVLARRKVDLQGTRSLEDIQCRGLAVEHQFYSETLRQLFSGESNRTKEA